MILPTKRITEPKSLLGMGAVILKSLKRPKDVSRLWETVKDAYSNQEGATVGPQTFTYDWFVLSLDFLFILGVIDVKEGVVSKRVIKKSSRARSASAKAANYIEPENLHKEVAYTA